MYPQCIFENTANTMLLSANVFSTPFFQTVSMYLDVFFHSPGKKAKQEKEETKKDEKSKKKSKEQDSKFPATDGVNLEYFLSELSDDDNSSW